MYTRCAVRRSVSAFAVTRVVPMRVPEDVLEISIAEAESLRSAPFVDDDWLTSAFVRHVLFIRQKSFFLSALSDFEFAEFRMPQFTST